MLVVAVPHAGFSFLVGAHPSGQIEGQPQPGSVPVQQVKCLPLNGSQGISLVAIRGQLGVVEQGVPPVVIQDWFVVTDAVLSISLRTAAVALLDNMTRSAPSSNDQSIRVGEELTGGCGISVWQRERSCVLHFCCRTANQAGIGVIERA